MADTYNVKITAQVQVTAVVYARRDQMRQLIKKFKNHLTENPKRAKDTDSADKFKIVSAQRNHVGMMDIISHIGAVSGIDDALYASTDIGTARKIISLARYLPVMLWHMIHPLSLHTLITGMRQDMDLIKQAMD